MKLLDKAKKPIIRKQRVDCKFSQKELRDLTLAWLKGEIEVSHVGRALGQSGSSAYGILAVTLRRLYINGSFPKK